MSGKVTQFGGSYVAWDYAYGINPKVKSILGVAPINPATGVQTVSVASSSVNAADGTIFYPLATNAPINIGSDSGLDIGVTPSAVVNAYGNPSAAGVGTVTFTGTYAHGNGDQITTGSMGLQEALNYASSKGGGTVILDNAWAAGGGTQAMVNAATVPAGVAIQDNRLAGGPIQTAIIPLTLSQILNAFTTPITIIPAAGAGTVIDVIDATLNLVYGSAAYSGGGAAQLSYGTALTYPATATWAATVYTSIAANQLNKVAGAAAVANSSNFINKAITYSNATAVFTGGTGGSGQLIVNYRVQSGIS